MTSETKIPKLEDIVQKTNGELKIDWGTLEGLRITPGMRRDYLTLNDEVLKKLEKEDHLVPYSTKGSYYLFDNGLNFSPRSSLGKYFSFKNKKDAEAFKKAAYSEKFYNVTIWKM